MTVTIGRRELLAALGSAAAAWPLAVAFASLYGTQIDGDNVDREQVASA
jgi:hypothetical protein